MTDKPDYKSQATREILSMAKAHKTGVHQHPSYIIFDEASPHDWGPRPSLVKRVWRWFKSANIRLIRCLTHKL